MSMNNLDFTDEETPSDIYKFIREIKQDVVQRVLPNENKASHNYASVPEMGEKGTQEYLNFKTALDEQNAVVDRLKTQLKRTMNETGYCNEALKEDLAREVNKLQCLVNHIVKCHQIFNIHEDFELATNFSEEEEISELMTKKKLKSKSKKPTRKSSRISSDVDCGNMANEMNAHEIKLSQMEKGIDHMTNRLKKVRKVCCTNRTGRKKSSRKTFERHIYPKIVSNLAKKEQEIQDLSMKLRVKKCDEKPEVENNFLRETCQKMDGEIHTLKTFVKEQNRQIKIYQEKYLNAQQVSEERAGLLRKMHHKSEQMEDCVRTEITKIKQDFQRQIHELTQQNWKISAEKNRIREEYRKKHAFQEELEKILPEFQRLQREEKCWIRERNKNLPGVIAELQEELQCMTYKFNKVCGEKDTVQENLLQSEAEVEKLREDTVRIINRTKNACEEVNKSLRGELADVEKQLAQCRAAAKIALNDRDNCIKNLQCQISVVETQFQEAKLQIENVRGHISQVTHKVTGGKTICKTCGRIL